MKKIVTFTLIGLAFAMAFAAPVLTNRQKAYFKNRRICVGRDTTTLPGYVITTWHRDGKPDTKAPAVVTNRLRTIVGREQNNPIQALAEIHRRNAERWQLAATTFSNRLASATSRLTDRRAEYVTKRDAAMLPTTKAIYQAFIDVIDNILEAEARR